MTKNINEVLFPIVKILIVLITIIIAIFLLKYFYQILNTILVIKIPTAEELKVVSFEIEKLEKFALRLGIKDFVQNYEAKP